MSHTWISYLRVKPSSSSCFYTSFFFPSPDQISIPKPKGHGSSERRGWDRTTTIVGAFATAARGLRRNPKAMEVQRVEVEIGLLQSFLGCCVCFLLHSCALVLGLCMELKCFTLKYETWLLLTRFQRAKLSPRDSIW